MPSRRDKHCYIEIHYDGLSCICEPEEVEGMLEDWDVDDLKSVKLTGVWMTRFAYERLPEFAGF